MKRVPSKRIKIDGRTWTVKIVRPPARSSYDGLCVQDNRTIYLHPEALKHRAIELVCHELIHARLFDIDEGAVEEIGRLAGEVCAWVAEQNDGVLV
jgi:hypothetical protein